jgi:quercetin dioxygenase-like cupin family protein
MTLGRPPGRPQATEEVGHIPSVVARPRRSSARRRLDRSFYTLANVKIAVIEGRLTEAVPIMFRLKFPANYKVRPHRYPGIENVTVISGTLNLGMGETFDAAKTHALTPGSVAIMPPGTPHFVWTSEETIGQVHSVGPWSVTYVNPADDPRKK